LELGELRRMLAESAGVSQGVDIDGDILDTEFQDLGYDSIAIMEIASRITSQYGIRIDDEVLAGAATPRRLLDLVNGV
jgi:acyl carrier protein